MNIGIDIDGVIQDCENWFRTYAEVFDIKYFNKGIVDSQAVKVQERMGWDEDTFVKYIYECMFYVMENAPLLPCAKDIIDKLKEMGHKLIIISARGSFKEREVEIAKEVLAKNNIVVDRAYFKVSDKLPVCVEEKIDYMIDDSILNVSHLSENGIKCLYFRSYGSTDINNDNVIDVRNWGEVYRFFNNLNNNAK